MSSYQGGAYSHDSQPSLGVLLLNLGTPDAPTPAALRRYLAEFLWDPRVVEAPRLMWWLVLHGIILRTRPARSAAMYQKIWTEEGSPLLVTSRHQAQGVSQLLASAVKGPLVVELGMRYGNPSIGSALQRLRQANAQQVIVLPLYPQYSAATTASTFDAVVDELKQWRWLPELRFINSYHDVPAYIAALADSIREQWASTGQPERLLFSFHGTPKRYFTGGDPYFCHCQKTARLVAEALGLAADRWQVTFQSQFGREEWLKPYTSEILASLGAAGIKSVDVICPGFSADCLETIEEIAMENKGVFLSAGGEQYHYIPALNERPEHLRVLADLVLQHAQGWPQLSAAWDSDRQIEELQQRKQRAQALEAKS